MIVFALIVSGLLLGVLLTILLVGKMMKNPTTRIWLSDWANWSNNQLPDDCDQLVRHGKWIASPDDKEDA
ncbi:MULTISPECIES: hypothetical protein [Limnobacter]|jgi:hypothetical protein|uniref:Uncharacterized protein n=1 Tax=Limnobacter profundi TaxID=2732163 RepID=A0ABX6N491_9BURK|nr:MULTISPECIES: hypothetical protein [unclassified Limnobacter]MAG81805.1 hypothetical protein [Sutterellaceae bacterium]MBA4314205.1 hypothetical protein [Alcaligenaceae bacterium]PZO13093.1 MAG: hypothetical protein DCE87_13740 [Betaproteobacteria bacterium]MAG82466.1 hypothetical protein [Sutterellaceae bacterium]MBT85318.1 hypothetical protein [Sutterellaceae bacterium]|tara:strand:+ start:13707 stop:13916 length:210 start_codon:yes stop_codon:yes gene_type:complete